MVEIMSDEYAKLIKKPKTEVFEMMWGFTSEFQRKFHLKQKRKKKIKFLF
jgi:intein-encoded DNA endonuclease-like protein